MEDREYNYHDHIGEVLDELNIELPIKYLKGQKEHGGRLWKKNVGGEIMGELIDFIVYFHTYKKQVDNLINVSMELKKFVKMFNGDVNRLDEALAPFFYKSDK